MSCESSVTFTAAESQVHHCDGRRGGPQSVTGMEADWEGERGKGRGEKVCEGREGEGGRGGDRG